MDGLGSAADHRLLAYRDDPEGFCREELGTKLWERQLSVLKSVQHAEQVAVKSGHGVGKTHLAANLLLWFLYSHTPSLVLSTAPSQRQVERLLWGEVRRLFTKARRSLPGRLLTTRLEAGAEQLAVGFSAKEPERAAGFHCENTLVIVDEASGVAPALYETLQGVLTSANCHLLLIGNPTQPTGTFHDAFRNPAWVCHTVSCLDSPNFVDPLRPPPVPALVTPAWVEARRKEWGEDSDAFRVRVLGEFPKGAGNLLVQWSWLESAELKGQDAAEPSDEGSAAPVVLGVDVARYGECETVVAQRQGDELLWVEAWGSTDLMETAGRVWQLVRTTGAQRVVLDVVGLGAGVFDRLKELSLEEGKRLELVGFESGARALDAEQFRSRRDEAYWELRGRYEDGRVGHREAWPTLLQQLSSLRYTVTSAGKTQIESKEELRRRGLPSPDWADAVCLAFAPVRSGPSRPVLLGVQRRV